MMDSDLQPRNLQDGIPVSKLSCLQIDSIDLSKLVCVSSAVSAPRFSDLQFGSAMTLFRMNVMCFLAMQQLVIPASNECLALDRGLFQNTVNMIVYMIQHGLEQPLPCYLDQWVNIAKNYIL